MTVSTASQSAQIYFNLSESTVEMVSEISSDGYMYNLCRINLSDVKSKLSQVNGNAYREFILGGGYLVVDSCMVTIKIDKAGNRTYSGSMDDYGNFWGSVYLDYEGIAHAVAWSNPDSLRSYFNITINYETQLRSRHTVFVCY